MRVAGSDGVNLDIFGYCAVGASGSTSLMNMQVSEPTILNVDEFFINVRPIRPRHRQVGIEDT